MDKDVGGCVNARAVLDFDSCRDENYSPLQDHCLCKHGFSKLPNFSISYLPSFACPKTLAIRLQPDDGSIFSNCGFYGAAFLVLSV